MRVSIFNELEEKLEYVPRPAGKTKWETLQHCIIDSKQYYVQSTLTFLNEYYCRATSVVNY